VGGMGVEGLVGMITGVEVLGGKRKRLDECNGDLTSTDNSFRVADKPSLMFSPRGPRTRAWACQPINHFTMSLMMRSGLSGPSGI
jgi:hypothetical protein